MSLAPRKKLSKETQCVHAGVRPDPVHGALMTPIVNATTFQQTAPGVHRGYDYTRAGNPTRQALEEALACMEGARFAVTFASGLAAEQGILLSLPPRPKILICEDVYGGTSRLFRRVFEKFEFQITFGNLADTSTAKALLSEKWDLVWIETPTNPLLQIIDIEAVSTQAKAHGATVVVDNTFASPVFQSPLALGADIVVHSSTKYLGGHSDVLGGVVMTNDDQWHEKIRFQQFACGAVPSPFDCFLLLRSLKTLSIRMSQHQKNAIFVAEGLQKLGICEVIFPGLESHPHHQLARKQMSGFSGMMSLRIKGGFPAVTRFLSRLELFVLAESLGGVESLVNHPETMTHASIPPEHRAKIGIDSGLLRLSVGIEGADDLLADLTQALQFSLKTPDSGSR